MIITVLEKLWKEFYFRIRSRPVILVESQSVWTLKEFDDEQILKAYAKDIEDRVAQETARGTAERMIRDGELPLEKIVRYVPALSLEELREIKAGIMQLA